MKSKLLCMWFVSVSLTAAFDWQSYVERNSDLKTEYMSSWLGAFTHYLRYGVHENRTSVDQRLSTSNFDWEYYVTHNNLKNIDSEAVARKHYLSTGYFENLPYCENYAFLILLHLYSFEHMDEYVHKINRFMLLNDQNSYELMINIPVDDSNIGQLDNLVDRFAGGLADDVLSDEQKLELIRAHTPYTPEKITLQMASRLYGVMHYLNEVCELPKERVHIMFSENRGMDVGGFLLQLDQLRQHPLHHDFLIKIHTKSNRWWGDLSDSCLVGAVNPVLRKYNGIYSNIIRADFDAVTDTFSARNKEHLSAILDDWGLEKKSFIFSGGSVFIVSSKFTDFLISNDDLLKRYYQLNPGRIHCDGFLEHAYERFFGFLMSHLSLDMSVVDLHQLPFKQDHRPADSWPPFTYDAEKIRRAIHDHDIKVMALYFPQFHEVEENNQFWGKGFTEWTMLNKFSGEKKKPHDTLGEYNMLDRATRAKQGKLAKEHGISAFCYYHYWFTDKPVMYKGLRAMLEDGEPQMPFAFCWANERWTRNWDGLDKEVLLEQEYGSEKEWEKHFEYLLPFFNDDRYIKQQNKPVFYIYNLKDIALQGGLEMLSYFKKRAREAGFAGIKIIGIANNFNDPEMGTYGEYVSGYAEHQPTYNGRRGGSKLLESVEKTQLLDTPWMYESISANKKACNDYTRGVFYGWDNSSRRVGLLAYKFIHLSYQAFERLLIKTVENIVQDPNEDTNYIMFNSWNEWCEQAAAEPSDLDGYAVLSVVKKIFGSVE